MMYEDQVNPWQPETCPRRLKRFGKMQEELGELIGIVARCQIQGIDEADPKTGKVNRLAMEEEIADVIAQCDLAVDELGLDVAAILKRVDKKKHLQRRWMEM